MAGRYAAPARWIPVQCTDARPGLGRTVRLHPRESLLQEARQLQDSPACAQYRQRRVVAEHRLAHLVQLGIRQAGYFGAARTRFQVYLAATVSNITLLADQFGRSNDFDPEAPAFSNVADAGASIKVNPRSNLRWVTASLTAAWPNVAPASERGFRLNFYRSVPSGNSLAAPAGSAESGPFPEVLPQLAASYLLQ